MSIPAVDGSSTSTWKAIINTILGLLNPEIAKRPYQWANAAARLAQTGMTAGEYGYQSDTGVTYLATGATTTVPWESSWTAFTPTLSGIAIGTGGSATNTASWKYEAGRVRLRGVITLGTSGASVSGGITVTLPVTAAALFHPYQDYAGVGTFHDTSANVNYFAYTSSGNASVTTVTFWNPGTNGIRTGSTASIPFTWAAGDSVSYDFVYDPA